jgi:hypothetical protein
VLLAPPGRDVHRQATRLREDLDDQLADIGRSEAKELASLDNDLNERGVLNSGMRVTGRQQISAKYDRERERKVREWQRAVEDLGLPTPPSPFPGTHD